MNSLIHKISLSALLFVVQGAVVFGMDMDLSQLMLEAVRNGNKERILQLISLDPDLISKKYNQEESTLLHIAAHAGKFVSADLLINNGADVNVKDKDNLTPLHVAACYGYKDIAELFIGNGADVRAQDSQGLTPLHKTALYGLEDSTELLIKKGAPLNTQDINGYTPLHLAALNDKAGVVALLVAAGADVEVKDKDGLTPKDLAELSGYTDTCEALKGKNDFIFVYNATKESQIDTMWIMNEITKEPHIGMKNDGMCTWQIRLDTTTCRAPYVFALVSGNKLYMWKLHSTHLDQIFLFGPNKDSISLIECKEQECEEIGHKLLEPESVEELVRLC